MPRLRRAAIALIALAAAAGISGCARHAPGSHGAAPTTAAFHTVKRGDTVSALSRRYGVAIQEIGRLNQLDSQYRIHVGQRLMLPSAAGVRTRRVAAAARPSRSASRQAASFTPSRLRPPVEGEIIRAYGEGAGAQRNKGVDIAADPGTPVKAAAPGQIAFVSDQTSPVGAVVLMQHAGGMTTIYGRLDRVAVSVGQHVAAGHPIARVARRREGDPALHFELRRGSDPVDPTPYL